MSVQETKLKAIADAIREKEGTTAPIRANDFPSRILALETGGVPEGVYTITLSSSDEAGGTVSGGGVASDGTLLAAVAEAADRYEFEGWQEDGETVSADTTYIFPATADRVLTAKFTETSNSPWMLTTLPASVTGRMCRLGAINLLPYRRALPPHIAQMVLTGQLSSCHRLHQV